MIEIIIHIYLQVHFICIIWLWLIITAVKLVVVAEAKTRWSCEQARHCVTLKLQTNVCLSGIVDRHSVILLT